MNDFAATVEMLNAAKARLSDLAALAEVAPPPSDDLRRVSGYACDGVALVAAHRGLTTAAAHLDVAVLAVGVLAAHQRAMAAKGEVARAVLEALAELMAAQGRLMDWAPVAEAA